MYVISTVYRPWMKWGRYLCNVRDIENNTVEDVTLATAERFALKFKNNAIQIPHWSWTGFNVLKELLMKWTWVLNHHVIDVSVF